MNPAELAKEYGFAEVFVFSPEPFTHYERRLTDGALHPAGTKLLADARAGEPWANAAIVLILPYRPYPPSVPVSGNYPASNRAYHAANRFIRALEENGVMLPENTIESASMNVSLRFWKGRSVR